MPVNAKSSGICTTCRHAATCVYLAGAKRPVLQCEEFEPCEESPPGKAPKSPAPKRPSSASRAGGRASVELMGLCVDCENRHTCTFPKPEGGVWHCQEYS